jgi:hypothetical protein
MMMCMQWTTLGAPRGDPPGSCLRVNVGQREGWLCRHDSHNEFYFWPNGSSPGFEILLLANKMIPKEELIKVAESVPPTDSRCN